MPQKVTDCNFHLQHNKSLIIECSSNKPANDFAQIFVLELYNQEKNPNKLIKKDVNRHYPYFVVHSIQDISKVKAVIYSKKHMVGNYVYVYVLIF